MNIFPSFFILSIGYNEFVYKFLFNYFYFLKNICHSLSSSGKVLDYVMDDPGSIPGVVGVEIFLHSFDYRLVQGSTQPSME